MAVAHRDVDRPFGAKQKLKSRLHWLQEAYVEIVQKLWEKKQKKGTTASNDR